MSSKSSVAAILRYIADKVERGEAKIDIDYLPDLSGQSWEITGVTLGRLPGELIDVR